MVRKLQKCGRKSKNEWRTGDEWRRVEEGMEERKRESQQRCHPS
jgi:hypothetical protein